MPPCRCLLPATAARSVHRLFNENKSNWVLFGYLLAEKFHRIPSPSHRFVYINSVCFEQGIGLDDGQQVSRSDGLIIIIVVNSEAEEVEEHCQFQCIRIRHSWFSLVGHLPCLMQRRDKISTQRARSYTRMDGLGGGLFFAPSPTPVLIAGQFIMGTNPERLMLSTRIYSLPLWVGFVNLK